MNRDMDPIDRSEREQPHAEPVQAREQRPELSRERQSIQERGYAYQISPAELETLNAVGQFRTVAIQDLARHRYEGKTAEMNQDLRALKDQGVVQCRTVWLGGKGEKLAVVVLTKQGKRILDGQRPDGSNQQFYAGLVKPREAIHDAAIYRMYQAEKERIERAGGQVRRVVLDYELKKNIYSPLAKAKALPPLEYARRQAEVAQANGLKVIHGKIPLPDLRIEYETQSGESSRIDLELATTHYRPSQMQDKAAAGFKMYAADGSAAHLSRVLEEREITAAILSL